VYERVSSPVRYDDNRNTRLGEITFYFFIASIYATLSSKTGRPERRAACRHKRFVAWKNSSGRGRASSGFSPFRRVERSFYDGVVAVALEKKKKRNRNRTFLKNTRE